MSASTEPAFDEIAALIETLHSTEQRLEQLTAGEVDSVSDSQGRTFLLRRAQEQLRHSEAAKRAAILDALPAHIALLDAQGAIVAVNAAWHRFGGAHVLQGPGYGVGVNYVEACEISHGNDAAAAWQTARGIRAVLGRTAASFSFEYRTHAAIAERWFQLSVTPLSADGTDGAVVMHLDISERMQSERAMRRTTELLQAVADGTPDHVSLKDLRGRYLLCNQALARFRGHTVEQVIGRDNSSIMDASEASAPMESDRRVIESGQPYSSEYTLTGLAGPRTFLTNKAPYRDIGGDVIGVVSISRDITERKRADLEREQERQLLRTLIDALPDMIYTKDVEGRFVVSNRTTQAAFGMPSEQALAGKTAFDVLPAEVAQRAHATALQVLSGQPVVDREESSAGADGATQWHLTTKMPLRDADGRMSGFVGIRRNITQLKREQEALRETQALLSMAGRLAQVGAWSVELPGTQVVWSDVVAKMHGRPVGFSPTLEEAIHHYPVEHRERIGTAFARCAEDGTPFDIEAEIVTVGGGSLSVRAIGEAFRSEDGKIVRVQGALQDLSEHKRAAQEMQRLAESLRALNAELEDRVHERTTQLSAARDEAEQANKAKSSFLAAMSHEIRTPMNGVIGMIDVLEETHLKGHQIEMVDLIRDSALSLLKIIDDILDFSKIEAGKLTVENEPMQPASVVEKVCSMLDHMAAKRDVQLSVYIDPTIPDTVLGDETRLRQVLVNLAGNAIKFSSGRALPGHVSVRAERVEGQGPGVTISFTVADDGIGMDAATLDRLFQPFAQADASTTRRFGGTGLGLAISSMLVGLMGGRIAVRSAPHQGSTFSVRLCFAPAEHLAAGPDDMPRATGLRCRIVGAERPLADDLATYLTHAGATVEHVANLAAAAASPQAPGRWTWLILPDQPLPALEVLRTMPVGSPDAQTRFVVLGRGKRHRPRVDAVDLISIDANALHRRALLRLLTRDDDGAPPDVPDPRAAPAPPTAAPSRTAAIAQGRLILVAEDNETNRQVILRQLPLIGFAADIVGSGSEALQRWRSGDFALVLTDLHMPDMDGYALAAAIRSEETGGRRTPIIALTANVLREEELRCRAMGMDGYLSKPVRLPLLQAELERWLGVAAATEPAHAAGLPHASPELPADLSVLTALIGDDPVVIREILAAFRTSAGHSRALMHRGLQGGRLQATADAAHSLKSGARSIGAQALGETCAQIESAAEAGRADAVAALLQRFDAQLDAVCLYLDTR